MFIFDQETATDNEFLSFFFSSVLSVQSCKTETTHGCKVTYSTNVYFNVKLSVTALDELRPPLYFYL